MIEQITKIVEKFKGVSDLHLTEETNLNTDLGLSSLDYFSLINEIEDEFKVKISDRELMKARTIGDLIAIIKKHQG